MWFHVNVTSKLQLQNYYISIEFRLDSRKLDAITQLSDTSHSRKKVNSLIGFLSLLFHSIFYSTKLIIWTAFFFFSKKHIPYSIVFLWGIGFVKEPHKHKTMGKTTLFYIKQKYQLTQCCIDLLSIFLGGYIFLN